MIKNIRIINTDKGKYIFDQLRYKYIKLTPEEMVRQEFIFYLVNEKKYPKYLMNLEHFFKVNGIIKRADLVVFDKECKPFLLAEFKNSSIKITDKSIEQIMIYNTVLNAGILVITNGKNILIFKKNESSYIRLEKLPDI